MRLYSSTYLQSKYPKLQVITVHLWQKEPFFCINWVTKYGSELDLFYQNYHWSTLLLYRAYMATKVSDLFRRDSSIGGFLDTKYLQISEKDMMHAQRLSVILFHPDVNGVRSIYPNYELIEDIK